MKTCSGVWVLANINRATDNKTAKDIMSTAIKRQLKLDGAISALTIICSKTDDMVISSGMESLRTKLDEDTKQAWSEVQDLSRRIRCLDTKLEAVQNGEKTARVSTTDVDVRRPAKRLRLGSLYNPASASDDRGRSFNQLHKDRMELKEVRRGMIDKVHVSLIQKRNELARQAIKKDLIRDFQE